MPSEDTLSDGEAAERQGKSHRRMAVAVVALALIFAAVVAIVGRGVAQGCRVGSLLAVLKRGDAAARADASEKLAAYRGYTAVRQMAVYAGETGTPDSLRRDVLLVLKRIGGEAVGPLASLLKGGPNWLDRLVARLRRQKVPSVEQLQRFAAVALGEIGDPRPVPALIGMFAGSDGMADTAMVALAKIGGGAVAALRQALKSPDPRTRWFATGALNWMDSPELFDDFIPLLRDPDPGVRSNAAKLLAEWGHVRLVDDFVETLVRFDDAETLGRVKPFLETFRGWGVDERIAAYLSDPDPKVRIRALGALADSGSYDEYRIEAALNDASGEVSGFAVKSLLEGPKKGTEKALRELLRHRDAAVRAGAVGALGAFRSGESFAALAAAAGDESAEVRRPAISALDGLDCWDTVELFEKALGDPDVVVRGAAVKGLSKSTHPRAGDILAEAAGGEDVELAGLAAAALEKSPPPVDIDAVAAEMKSAASSEQRFKALKTMAGLWLCPPAENFTPALTDDDARVRAAAVETLGRSRDPEALNSLIGALEDTDENVRATAVGALAHNRDPRAGVALVGCLRQPSFAVRKAAMDALRRGRAPDRATTEALLDTFANANAQARQHAFAVMGRPPGEEVFQVLLGALTDRDPWVVETAALHLGRRGDPRAVPHLIEALNGCVPVLPEDPDMSWSPGPFGLLRACARALARIGDRRAAEPLAAVLDHGNRRVREEASRALRTIAMRGHDVRAVCVDALSNAASAVRLNALQALLFTPEAGLADAVGELVADPIPEIAVAAVTLIARIEPPDRTARVARALKHPSAEVRAAAVWCLPRYDPGTAAPLIEATKDPDRSVRLAAVQYMATLGRFWALDTLTELSRSDDTEIERAAQQGLSHIHSAF